MNADLYAQNKELFQPFRLGNMNMKNRFVVPSMNRMRADKETCIPVDLMGSFYTQRYHNGLIITDDCYVSSDYNPFKGLPGLFSEQQVLAWVDIIDRVHSRAGNIVAQLFHPGRVVSESQLPSGVFAKAPSEIRIEGQNRFSRNEQFAMPREITKEEIKNIVKDFQRAALNAKNAGFDGIQINAGSGFLIDQFLRDSSNSRKDEYGGSIENRCRFCLEIIDEILKVYSNEKVSIKISPINEQYGMKDSNPFGLVAYLLQEVEKRKLAFVEVRKTGYLDILPTQKQPQEIDLNKLLEDPMPEFFKIIRNLYKGNMIGNSDFNSFEEANYLIKNLGYQGVAFDILTITNPDIPQRIKERGNINKQFRGLFLYAGGRSGYIDYPYYIAHSKL